MNYDFSTPEEEKDKTIYVYKPHLIEFKKFTCYRIHCKGNCQKNCVKDNLYCFINPIDVFSHTEKCTIYIIQNSKCKMIANNNVLRLLSSVFCSLSFIWLLKALFLGLYPDFRVYYYVSKLFLQGINYYAHPELLHISYSYPPIDFLLFLPFTVFSFPIAETIWTILNFIFLLASLYYLSKIFSLRLFSTLGMLLSGLTFMAFPTKFTIGMGQLNLLVLFLIVYGLWLAKQKKFISTGVLLGAALSIKFSPVFLPFYFLLRLNKKVLSGMILTFLITLLLVVIFVPYHTYTYYILKIFPDFVVSSWKLEYYNQSLSGVIGRSVGTGAGAGYLKTIITLVAVSVTFWVILKNKQKDFLSTLIVIGTLITLSLLFNTFSWQHHFVWTIIPFYSSVFFMLKKKMGTKYYIALIISYVLISINFSDPNVLPVVFQSHVFYGALLLLLIDLHILRNNQKKLAKGSL